MSTKIFKTHCSDWILGWGLGGHNKLGKLQTTEVSNEYIWIGHAQGRHGQKLAKRNEIRFTNDDGVINIVSKKNDGAGLPVSKVIHEAIDRLHSMRSQVEVIFRKDASGVFALFPYEIADPQNNCLSYAHVGQHGAANLSYCLEKTKPAKIHEYADLLAELKSIGYSLKIIKRVNRTKHLNSFIF